MPATYTVVQAQKGADKPDRGYGPMMTILMSLKNGDGEPQRVEWYTKAGTPVPAEGSEVTGDISESEYGLKFKKAQHGAFSGSSGPSKDYKADPAKQAAIAMESAHKVAVQILDIAIRDGHYKPPDDRPISEMTGVVRQVAQQLYAQILEASEAAAK